ncbi:MAG: CpsD/CapB family tyrosine-protein kinase, partial [Vicinamibacterales bacterium]
MSRIQDILAKAERDGTARRTQATGSFAPGPAPAAFPQPPAPRPPTSAGRLDGRVDGTSALDDAPVTAGATEPPGPSAVVDARTATPTLHPLLVAAIEPHADVAERYRSIRARISHREETMPVRTMMVTSPGAGDGKSITAANLALTMAQELQRRVVLVDADFRGSSLHALFGLDGAPGLAEVLTGEATLDEVMVHMPDYRLTVIPAGRTPQFPTELLGSTAMRRIVDTLRGRFDRVLFDTPAVMPLADAGTFAPMADGVLMVVRAGLTPRPALDRALSAFDEDRVLGVVLNDI